MLLSQEIKHTSILFVVTCVHNEDAVSGLRTKHFGVTLAGDGLDFDTLIGIRLWTFLPLVFLLFRRDQYERWEILTLISLGIKCREFGQLECPHFSDIARIFGSLVIKLIFEICATLTHLWGRLGDPR